MEIKIGPYYRTIQKVGKLKRAYGTCVAKNLTIKIAEQNQQIENDTILHEILHAIFYTHGIRIKDEEQLITLLTPAILDVLQNLFGEIDIGAIIAEHQKNVLSSKKIGKQTSSQRS